ncbi:MBOAT-domain-containing protein [Eremomyces bilateralis CBS 781.70]|uniref:MBOAT-domain-containing protein n=1 Tax=Eremomyces bilateralis CBS 781.70 TaxID=1392243 RepID=A0A6G1G5A3_9PEZI|nr:MBOAT-domain-containing protein [Eremomyces bilateralis CBS 781.70]KAF1813121.1 MBOAT-domain-containing protein [Eremomyces bilateralis CBS 781.70]
MIPGIDAPFAYLGGKLGASTDELKLIFSFLISYPLAGVLKRIPDTKPWQKNVFSISVSLFYLVGLFDLWAGLRTLFCSAAATYLIAKYVQGSLMPWLAFAFLMGHLSISHLERQFVNNPAAVDVTGAQMVLLMKLSSFAWNVHDGKFPDSELSEHQRDRAIKQMPGLLDYAGYFLFFPSLMGGPSFDYVDYTRYINTSMFELPPGTDPSKAPRTRKKRRVPQSHWPAMRKAAEGIFWIVIFLQLVGRYNNVTVVSDSFMEKNFFHRVFILHMLGFTTRAKYYGVWSLTEGACILSGIGYGGVDPKTGQANWNRLQNIRPIGVETAQNVRAYLGNWNLNTNNWLRNYVYLRVTPKGKKPGFRASLATFSASAMWHGFFPGYYLAFVLASFLQTMAKHGRRLVRPFFLDYQNVDANNEPSPTKYKWVYDAFTWFITQTAFAFVVAPFIILTLDGSLRAWSGVYWYCIVGVAFCQLFLLTPFAKQLAAAAKRRQGLAPGKRPPVSRTTSHEAGGRTLGLPEDPEGDIDEIVEEVKAELNKIRAQRGGQALTLTDIRGILEEKVKELGHALGDETTKTGRGTGQIVDGLKADVKEEAVKKVEDKKSR